MGLENRLNFIEMVNREKFYNGLDKKPFDAIPSMISRTFDLIRDVPIDRSTEFNRARAIYDWCRTNIKREFDSSNVKTFKDVERLEYFHKSASETFELKTGMCVDVSFLYSTMAKIAGVDAGIAAVYVDADGDDCDHMCSWINFLGNNYLVDVTRSGGFNVRHKKFRVFSENEARDFYNHYSKNYNARNWDALLGYSNHKSTNNYGEISKVCGLIAALLFSTCVYLEACDKIPEKQKIILPIVEKIF